MKNFKFLPAFLPVLLLFSCSKTTWPDCEGGLSLEAFKALKDSSSRFSLSGEIVSFQKPGCLYVADETDFVYVYGMSSSEGLQAGDRIGFSARPGTFNGRLQAQDAELLWRQSGTYPGFSAARPEAGWLELPSAEAEENMVFLCHKGPSGRRNYSVFYDASKHLARWVCYPLAGGDCGAGRSDAYAFDPLLEETVQADLSRSYQNRKKGGEEFIRGHLVPSYERMGRENMDVFLSTNIIPQSSALNSGVWLDLENAERRWAASCDTLYVVVGTLCEGGGYTVSDNSSPRRKIPVPGELYRAVLALMPDGSLRALAAIFSNSACPYAKFTSLMAISVDELEELTGEDFFSNLPSVQEDAVEAADPAQDPWWWNQPL